FEPCSFSPDTLVLTDRGEVPIQDVVAGDRVWSREPATGVETWHLVTAARAHEDDESVVVSLDRDHVEASPRHPFFSVERGWVEAQSLRLGEHVATGEGGYSTVVGVVGMSGRQWLYDLSVEGAHDFFVGS